MLMKKMKKTLGSVIVGLSLVIVPCAAYGLTLADIELLISLGLLNSEQAELAREAIGITPAVAPGTAGATVQSGTNESITCLTLTENMFLGSKGTAVGALQLFLQNEGHYTYPQITNYYGVVTQTAVVDFQLAEKLITSRGQLGAGSVGPLTRERVQQVSCARANNQIVNNPNTAQIGQQTPVIETQAIGNNDGTSFTFSGTSLRLARRQSGGTTEMAPNSDGMEVTLESVITKEYTGEGIMFVRYQASLEPDEDLVDYFIFTVVCDNNNVELTRKEFNNLCGQSAVFDSNRSGKASFKIEFENTGGLNQTIGMGVEAYDSSDRLLGLDEVIDALSEPTRNGSTRNINQFKGYTGIEKNDGFANSIGIVPTDRACSRREQLDYLRFIMTATVHEDEDPPLPPVCLPGNVQCSFQSPPTYCKIVDGPDSGDLCSGANYYFYDGKCMLESEVLKYT